MNAPPVVKCPFCRMPVDPQAVKCGNCQEWLTRSAPEPPLEKSTVLGVTTDFLCVMLGIFVLGPCVLVVMTGIRGCYDGLDVEPEQTVPEQTVEAFGTMGGTAECNAIQVLIDDLNKEFSSDLFDRVFCTGTKIFVFVTDEFVELDEGTKDVLIVKIHYEWTFNNGGETAVFKSSEKIIAEM